MKHIKKTSKSILLKLSILGEFFHALWKYKLWWGIPIIFVLTTLLLLLFAVGHTGGAALIYPLF